MNRWIRHAATAALYGLLACGAFAADLRVPLPQRPSLVIPLPDSWQGKVNRASSDLPPTIAVTTVGGRPFQLMITPIWPSSGDARPPTPEFNRAMVAAGAERAKAQSVEAELPVRDLSGPGVFGAYFSATDKAPKPGEFRNMTQGLVVVGELHVSFTLLSNGDPAAVTGAVLQVMQSLRRE